MRKNQSGFTLVELMIVVAIIGILAAIAIPNYQKYQAKSRTTEAKIQLSALYTAEKSFLVEYSSFTACLNAAGFAPDAGQRYYVEGVDAAGTVTGATCGQAGALSACNGNLGTNAPTCADADGSTFFVAQPVAVKGVSGATAAARTDLPVAVLGNNSFTLGAAGAISTVGINKWTITDQKALTETNLGY